MASLRPGSDATDTRIDARLVVLALGVTASAVLGRAEWRAFAVAASLGCLANVPALATVEWIIVRVHAGSAAGQVSTTGAAVPTVGVGIQTLDHIDTLALTAAVALNVTRAIATAAMLRLAFDPAPRASKALGRKGRDTAAALPPVTRWVS